MDQNPQQTSVCVHVECPLAEVVSILPVSRTSIHLDARVLHVTPCIPMHLRSSSVPHNLHDSLHHQTITNLCSSPTCHILFHFQILDQYHSVIVKMNFLLLFLSLTSIPFSVCLVIPSHGQDGMLKPSSLDTQEDRQAAYGTWLKAYQQHWDVAHNSTEDELAQKIKRDLVSDFKKWLSDRGGQKDNELMGNLWIEFEKEKNVKVTPDGKNGLKGPFDDKEDLIAVTDRLIFKTDQFDFASWRLDFHDPTKPATGVELDWTSDACTGKVDKPMGLRFKAACQRNDFAILNTSTQSRYTECMQKRISDRFKKDLKEACNFAPAVDKQLCDGEATRYAGYEVALWRPLPQRVCDPGESDTDLR